MLPATVKLCCGISHQHFRNVTGLKKAAMASIGQEITQLRQREQHLVKDLPCVLGLKNDIAEPKGSSNALKDKELYYITQGKEALQRALEILDQLGGWQYEITHTNGDTVSSKVIPEVGKVFKLEAVLDATPRQLYYELFEKLEEISTWNPNVSKIQIVQKIDQNTMVTHEVTSLTPGNLIGQRDFVSIRHCWRQDSVFCLAGAAIQIESLPPQNGFVRAEDGPSCIIVKPLGTDKSHFTWLLNMDLKGWLPKSLVNQALPQAQADFVKHLRKKLSTRITSGQR
ncbi:steroidogenic acute regulatory protein, mitochondrial [Polypterus senegalus]|uniref:steroidogenic acute regulatory protein, mitochondrial n=1 Tax=Polypterus senegalus TaxID=55291 RepID=UPI0019623E61|nr:steroidogenic acute regulatory protein, mitochondrial [Polypterus senegalus]